MVKRKLSPRNFFTEEEKGRIVQAIREAEGRTSGEIRVYLERKGKDDTMERAREIFQNLGMTRTQQRNGVLIYFSLSDHRFAVLGDQGIYEKVGGEAVPAGGGGFWNDVVAVMQDFFAREEFAEGLAAGIRRIGEKLKTYFPWEKGDINELPDAV